jgi:hypothetical protein
MSIQSCVNITARLLGDGSTKTATIVLNATPFYVNQALINFNPTPDSVSVPIVADANGQAIPATATLSHNGKQVIITLSTGFTGIITVTFNLGYSV